MKIEEPLCHFCENFHLQWKQQKGGRTYAYFTYNRFELNGDTLDKSFMDKGIRIHD